MKPAPIIHIHIGSLVEKIEISTGSFDLKTDSGLDEKKLQHQLKMIREFVRELTTATIHSSQEVLKKVTDLDNNQ